MATSASALASWLVRARGRVQGVGFREACVREARSRAIDGWVRNRDDGTVELLLQADADALAAYCDWLREGSHPALVDTLDIAPMTAPFARVDGFDRKPTA